MSKLGFLGFIGLLLMGSTVNSDTAVSWWIMLGCLVVMLIAYIKEGGASRYGKRTKR